MERIQSQIQNSRWQGAGREPPKSRLDSRSRQAKPHRGLPHHGPCPILFHRSWIMGGSWGAWGAMRCTVPSDDADGCRPETAKEVASPAEMLHAGALSSSHQEVGRPGHGPHDLQPCPSC